MKPSPARDSGGGSKPSCVMSSLQSESRIDGRHCSSEVEQVRRSHIAPRRKPRLQPTRADTSRLRAASDSCGASSAEMSKRRRVSRAGPESRSARPMARSSVRPIPMRSRPHSAGSRHTAGSAVPRCGLAPSRSTARPGSPSSMAAMDPACSSPSMQPRRSSTRKRGHVDRATRNRGSRHVERPKVPAKGSDSTSSRWPISPRQATSSCCARSLTKLLSPMCSVRRRDVDASSVTHSSVLVIPRCDTERLSMSPAHSAK
mmetsp:Transcript_9093/g.23144  ORF Transcript_9093/g.23144 Transcript_9093/m.23144 type:complete len:259 (+) Transcript_9093:111-887(+)